MPKLPHVAVLIETSRSYGRQLLRGVRRYISARGPWSVFVELRALESSPPPWLKNWRGDGILTRSGSPAMVAAIRRTGAPAVELRATRLRHPFPFVGVDNRALGQMVVEHFRDRGFRQFGVYGLKTELYFTQRCENFIRTVENAGFSCDIHWQAGDREKPAEWERQQADLETWLAELPKPVAIMACTDQLGFWLLDACKRQAISVPEEVAVVGVENDETLCSMASPPLSSIRLPGEQIGYEAAALLDRLMRGKSAPKQPRFVPPTELVARQSSDIVAIADRELAQAVRFIREHACKGVNVADVLRAVPMSRSSLERRMRDALGRSPNAELNRVRLQRVRQLLADTDLTLAAVARRAGFPHPQYMCELFKQQNGQTPGAFRRSLHQKK